MKSKMVSILLCLVLVSSIFAAFTQNLGPLSMNASAAGGLADSPWPMFRGNLNHTGVSPYDTSANNGQLKWTFSTGDMMLSSPAIGYDGTIYIGSRDNKLYAINPDGTERWSFLTGGLIDSSPAIGSDETIYIGSGDWKLYAINPDGSEKWNFMTEGYIKSSPSIGYDGTIYFGSIDHKLYAVNPDGTEKWNFTTGDGISFSSAGIGSDGIIYVGSIDNKIYAIYPNGTEKWNFETGNYVISSPAIGFDGTIYVTSLDSKLYAINHDGSEKWNNYLGGGTLVSSPAIGHDGTIYVGSSDNKLYAINPDGTEKWNFTTMEHIFYSSPAIGSEGTIYIGSYDFRLYAINPDGTQKWNFLTGRVIEDSPAIGSDGTIYIGSSDNKLYAIGNPSLMVEVTSHFSELNSAAQSAIKVHVTDGTNSVPGATVNLTTDNGGFFSPQSGTTDLNGNFTSIFNAPTVTTQIICRITAKVNKSGYNNGSGYVDITIKPIPWPMFRHNLNHTGVSPYDTSWNPGKLKWSFTTGNLVISSPAIGSDGTIYVGSFDYKLYAINSDGTEKWSFTTGDVVDSSPAIALDGTIYVGSWDNKLYAINPGGTEKWNFTTGENIVRSSPAIGSDGTIYVGSTDGKLYAINPDGTEKWNLTTSLPVASPAIGSDGTIYIGSGISPNKLYAINPNGTEKWSFTTGSFVSSSAAIGYDGTIYVGSGDNKLYAINPDGSEKWSFTTGAWVLSSSAIGSDGTIYVGSSDNKLYAVNPDGTEKWSFTTGSYVGSSPAIGSDGTIYVGSNDNKLYALNPNGTERWNFTTGDIIRSSPAISSDGTIYVGSFDNKLYAIGKAVTPPTLYINISQDKDDAILYWDPPSTPGIDHYLIYRSISQTDFDFNTVWVNTSKDNESSEPAPIPLRTMWNDTKAAVPSNPNYEKEYYYIIRAVNIFGKISTSSRTVGKWTKTFPQGVSTFSLPLEPLETRTTDYYLTNMNATYIKWMNQTTHTWMKHGDGGVNNTQIKLGEGYEVKFGSQTNYTFTGMPGAMIKYDDDTGFLGFDSGSDAKNFSATVDSVTGNVTLTWDQPSSMDIDDQYLILRSTERDGFWNGNYIQLANLFFDVLSYTDISNATAGTQYYYMIIPVNETGAEGASTYSVGVWTEEYLSQYDTIGIPLKLSSNQTADWFCDNIPDTIGINYYIYSGQRWSWHSTRMSQGAFDPLLEMVNGYQISTTSATKFTFIGV